MGENSAKEPQASTLTHDLILDNILADQVYVASSSSWCCHGCGERRRTHLKELSSMMIFGNNCHPHLSNIRKPETKIKRTRRRDLTGPRTLHSETGSNMWFIQSLPTPRHKLNHRPVRSHPEFFPWFFIFPYNNFSFLTTRFLPILHHGPRSHCSHAPPLFEFHHCHFCACLSNNCTISMAPRARYCFSYAEGRATPSFEGVSWSEIGKNRRTWAEAGISFECDEECFGHYGKPGEMAQMSSGLSSMGFLTETFLKCCSRTMNLPECPLHIWHSALFSSVIIANYWAYRWPSNT